MAEYSFNANSWNQVWAITQILLPTDSSKYARVKCPVLLSASAIAVQFNVPGIKVDSWTRGGYLNREVNSGLIAGGQYIAKLNQSNILHTNRLCIFTYPDIVADYSLVFDSLFAGEVSLFAWEYVG
jgi:hypothetical protein